MGETMMFRLFSLFSALVLLASGATVSAFEDKSPELTLVVMDPLAGPLACDCVKGYAQRKYEKLGEFLTKHLSRKVNVVWGETLESAMEKSEGKVDIIVGKHSVVLSDAKDSKLSVTPLARLTDLKDKVVQTGLFVVRANDPAKSVEDLRGYRIFFGPEDCDEKSAAPMAFMKEKGVALPSTIETAPSCSNAAVMLMELPKDAKAAAIISSYAGPLLEGCGKVAKGDLRVIGESKPVPFITLFVKSEMPAADQKALSAALEEVGLDAQMLIDLETASGFVPWKEEAPAAPAASVSSKKKD